MSETRSDIQMIEGISAVIRSDSTRRLMAMIQRIAPHPTAVLIIGETGSGKELIARSLHHYSLRGSKALIDVNCAAIPEHLIESELFGYDKGAFSGADTNKQGFFELADGGTLFLDEVGELEPKVQVKLLRVLDGAPYFRLGGSKKVNVNVRIIAATNRDLELEVNEGKFRRDLYHRLSQIQLRVPPLRERPEDLAGLTELFLEERRPGARFSQAAMNAIMRYSWPGNVRELKNVVTKAAIMSEPEKDVLGMEDLPPEIFQQELATEPPAAMAATASAAAAGPSSGGVADLDSMERRMIFQALEQHNGDQTRAAEQLGISRRTLSRKLKVYGVTLPAGISALGTLSVEQQERFRALLDVRVDIRSRDGHEQSVKAINISMRGMGIVGVTVPPFITGPLDMNFTLPDENLIIHAKGEMSWVDASGRGGIRFSDVTPRAGLQSWLQKHLQGEGWAGSVFA
jgi:transcriptional regulator with GAF, ATPase, and Fis domain